MASIEVISYFTFGQVTNILYFVKIRYWGSRECLSHGIAGLLF